MYCPACGQGIADDSVFCRYCGTQVGSSTAVASVSALVTQGSSLACPRCDMLDAVRHITSFVAEGVTEHELNTQWIGRSVGGAVPHTRGVGVLESMRARTISGRSDAGISEAALVARLRQVADINRIDQHNRRLMQPAPPDPKSNTFDKNASVDPYYYWIAELRMRNWLVIRAFISKWESLYYCSRCAGAFVPPQGKFAPLGEIEDLLYEYPSVEKQDYCQIDAATWVLSTWGLRFLPQPRLLFPVVYDANGIRILPGRFWSEPTRCHGAISGTPFLEKTDKGTGLYILDDPECYECKSNFNKLVAELTEEGWTQLREKGQRWYQARLIRQH